MKLFGILITSFILLSKICYTQNNYATFDSIESSFESIKKNIQMPCQWEMTSKARNNGKCTFFDKDSTALEFDFYKTSSIPFYTTTQTDFETTKEFYKWELKKSSKSKKIFFSKVEENKEAGFVIVKVKDSTGDFYRILARHNDLVYSIKIFNKVLPLEKQLEKLKTLHDLNKN
jgi:hypothetical protein